LILDTNAFSALADGDAELREVLRGHRDLAVPAIVLGEFEFGASQSRSRARYEQWLEFNLPLFTVLAVERETARAYARVRQELKAAGMPIPVNDVWIAALARQHHLPLVTRDRHFHSVSGLRVVGW
jgi:tRNA(fMet)-specific endonuclease VapC